MDKITCKCGREISIDIEIREKPVITNKLEKLTKKAKLKEICLSLKDWTQYEAELPSDIRKVYQTTGYTRSFNRQTEQEEAILFFKGIPVFKSNG